MAGYNLVYAAMFQQGYLIGRAECYFMLFGMPLTRFGIYAAGYLIGLIRQWEFAPSADWSQKE